LDILSAAGRASPPDPFLSGKSCLPDEDPRDSGAVNSCDGFIPMLTLLKGVFGCAREIVDVVAEPITAELSIVEEQSAY
jgi:hypothetical protein